MYLPVPGCCCSSGPVLSNWGVPAPNSHLYGWRNVHLNEITFLQACQELPNLYQQSPIVPGHVNITINLYIYL